MISFFSEQAERDIRNIYEYIAIEKQAPEIARELVLRIEEQILRLFHSGQNIEKQLKQTK